MSARLAASIWVCTVPPLIGPGSAAAQEGSLEPEAGAAVREIVAETTSEHRIPGLSIGIVRDGRIAYAAGFGATSPEGGAPATAETMYRLASVTKPFTSVAVLQLAEAGSLDLDDPARRHCPSAPARGDEPTIRQLLAHQGGVRHTTDREDTGITGDMRLAESVRRIADEELAFEPGTETGYTSWGYAVLGCVVEEVSGRRYFDHLRETILEPAGMTSTHPDRPDFDAPGFSPGFRARGGDVIPSEVVDTRFKISASGLISTVTDLSRFAVALFEGELLGPGATEALFEPRTTRDGETTRYTLGWVVASGRTHGDAYYFAGSMEGTTALLYLIPERGYALAILANRERFAQEIATMIGPLTEAVLEDD